jgi:soluble lytic murein transglycosylase-like protein
LAAGVFAAPRSLSVTTEAHGAGDVLRAPASPGSPYDRLIEEAASVYGVSAELVRSVIQVESNFDARAVSPKGAQGLMQLAPATARWLGIANPFDPRQNIFGGVRYLSMMLERHDGNVPLALASYNAGPSAVRRHRGIPPYRETRGYVRKVMARTQERAPEIRTAD